MKTIYQTIKSLALPIVKAYHADVTTHDRKSCREMKPGDVAFWAARECGSFFVRCSAHDDEATPDGLRRFQTRREYFEACIKLYPGLRWHMLESLDGPRGHVVQVSESYMREAFERRESGLRRAWDEARAAVPSWEHIKAA